VTSIITDPASQGLCAPTATQDGILSNCNNYAMAKAGDNCVDFAKGRVITTDQFYSLNPVLSSVGADCGLQLWSLEYYCIGSSTAATTATLVSLPLTTTPASHITASDSTQTGIAANCNKFAVAPKGDICPNFAKTNEMTNN
jgi:hypothetical protein